MRFKPSSVPEAWDSGSSYTPSLRDEEQWKCCFCCHVRTGTVLLGIIHMAFHLLSLVAVVVALLHPQVFDPTMSKDQVSVIIVKDASFVLEKNHLDQPSIKSDDLTPHKPDVNGPLLDGWTLNNQTLSARNLNVSFTLILFTTAITILLVYGAIKGKASYLMPFFCVEVFSFSITSLSVISYFSLFSDLRTIVARTPDFPMREQFLNMDPIFLAFFMLAVVLISLSFKAYCICLVWKCYKYLLIRESIITSESEDIMPNYSEGDLPDYATAVAGQKFYSSAFSSPPPPYSAIAAVPPNTEGK